MYKYQYANQKDIEEITQRYGLCISEMAVRHESERQETDSGIVTEQMKATLDVMKTNITAGITSTVPSIGGLIGKNAAKMFEYAAGGQSIGGILSRAVAYALAVTEENARMKRIAACPTAGACGVVPGCLFAVSEQMQFDEDAVLKALFNASAIGIVIANNATISGAEGGCQAEIGTASSMAASALTEMCGGSVAACLNAAAIALKNMLGLVCDPVAGLVEVPCSKRNAMGVANAIAAADMALAGITSVIPLDEVVKAMKEVGRSLPYELRETAKGGVAASETAREISGRIKQCAADTHDLC